MDLKLQTYSLRFLLILFGVFVGVLAGCVVLGIFASPAVVIQEAKSFSNLDDTFDVDLEDMSSHNQALGLYLTVETLQMPETVTKTMQMRLKVTGQNELGQELAVVADKVLDVNLYCVENRFECDLVSLLYLPFIEYSGYSISLSFESDPRSWMMGVRLELEYGNDQFTLFELISRMALLACTLGVAGFFWFSLRKIPIREWAIEQKWTSVLLLFLVGLNDPFFALSLKWWFFDLLDQILASSFLAVLMLFWLIMFDSLLKPNPNDRTMKWFYLPKFALIGLFWVCMSILYLGFEIFDFSSPLVITFFVLTLVLVSVYILWLVFMAFKLIPEIQCWRKRSSESEKASEQHELEVEEEMSSSFSPLPTKIKFFFFFTLFVIGLTLGGVLFGALGPLASTGAEVLAFFALFNFYIYILAICYLPAVGNQRGLDMIVIGSSDGEDRSASDLDFASSTDLEISLSDVGLMGPAEPFSPNGADDDDFDF